MLLLTENSRKTEIMFFFRSAIFHMKARVSLKYFVNYCRQTSQAQLIETFSIQNGDDINKVLWKEKNTDEGNYLR